MWFCNGYCTVVKRELIYFYLGPNYRDGAQIKNSEE
jgi:hypothetical protein